MPQLDKLTYTTQIFWLLLSFTSFYFIILKNVLPKILLNIKVRETIVNDMLVGNSDASAEVSQANQKFVQINERVIQNIKSVVSDVANSVNNTQTGIKQVQQFQDSVTLKVAQPLRLAQRIIKGL